MFTALDREFLPSLGIEVVDDPQAFAEIGTKTIVYAIGGYRYIEGMISEGPWPAAFVTTSFDQIFETAANPSL